MNTDLRLFIYEQYGNGQIDRDTARALISRISGPEYYERVYLNAMVEIDAAESAFMESALDYANGYADQFTFEAQAETLSQKISNAWKAFCKWVAEMWDKALKAIGIRKKEPDVKGMAKERFDMLKKIEKDLYKVNANLDKHLIRSSGDPHASMINTVKSVTDAKELHDIAKQPWYMDLLTISDLIGGVFTKSFAIAKKSASHVVVGFGTVAIVVMSIKKVVGTIIDKLSNKGNDEQKKKAMPLLNKILKAIFGWAIPKNEEKGEKPKDNTSGSGSQSLEDLPDNYLINALQDSFREYAALKILKKEDGGYNFSSTGFGVFYDDWESKVKNDSAPEGSPSVAYVKGEIDRTISDLKKSAEPVNVSRDEIISIIKTVKENKGKKYTISKSNPVGQRISDVLVADLGYKELIGKARKNPNPGQMNAIKAKNQEVASLYDKFQGFKWIKIVNDAPAN